MSRTLLYYPTFEIPSEQWLKDGLLYWDAVGSIVPERFKHIVKTNDLEYLSEVGLYKCFNPNSYVLDDNINSKLTEEFKQRLDSPEFANEIQKPSSKEYLNIAFEKMNYDSKQLVIERKLTPDHFNNDGWIPIKKPAAMIYMGLLARYLAENDPDYVQPSTDQIEYEDIIYRCGEQYNPLQGMALSLKNLLPRVAPDTNIRKTVEFKNRRRDELICFRVQLDEVQKKLSNCKSKEEAKLLITQFQEQIEISVTTIKRLMKEQRITSIFGTLRTIIRAKTPKWLAITAGSSALIGDPNNAIFLGMASAAGYISTGAIELARYLLDRRNDNQKIKEMPFSYLYFAGQEDIVGVK